MAGKGSLSKPRRPECGEERRNRGERSRSDTSYGTPDVEPSHPVHLTSLGTKHVPHLAPQHTPRRGPAAARPAPRGEVDGDRHSRMLPRGQGPGHDEAVGTSTNGRVGPAQITRLWAAEISIGPRAQGVHCAGYLCASCGQSPSLSAIGAPGSRAPGRQLCRDQRFCRRTVRHAQNVQFRTTLPTCGPHCGHDSAFPRKRLVKSRTKRFRGNVRHRARPERPRLAPRLRRER